MRRVCDAIWLSLLLLLAMTVSAQAQTFRAQFPPSADHNTVSGTQPILTGYDLVIALSTAPTVPVLTVDIGKPAPNAQNIIDREFTADMQSQPRNAMFVARIVAKGPGGSNSTPNSSPFPGLLGPPAAPTAAPTIVVLP